MVNEVKNGPMKLKWSNEFKMGQWSKKLANEVNMGQWCKIGPMKLKVGK